MATLVKLINGNFQDFEGNIVANGSLKLEISQDEQLSSSTGQLCGGRTVSIPLDASGNILGSSTSPSGPAQYVYPTDAMVPINASYTGWVYTAQGQLVWGPNYGLLVPSGATFNVDNWVPNSTNAVPNTSGNSITLETNGVVNPVQNVENLIAGSNITLTADGSGGTTITAGAASFVSLVADGVTDNLATINAAIAALPSTGGTIELVGSGFSGDKTCYVSDAITLTKPSTVFRGSGGPVNDGFYTSNIFRGAMVLKFAAGKSGIVVNAAESVLIENLGVLSLDSGADAGDNGIWVKGFSSGSVTVRNCGISSFGGVGLLIDSSGGGNCDHWRVDQVICWENFGDGFQIFGGVDGNAGTAINLNCTGNGGWGINVDSGAVSNMFLSSHVSGNTGGGTRCNQTSNTFMNHYTESSPAPTSTFVFDSNCNNSVVWFHDFAQPVSITNFAPTNLIYYHNPDTSYPGFTGLAINTQAFSGGYTYRIQNGSFNANDLSIADSSGRSWLDFNYALASLLSLQTFAAANLTGATSSGSTNSGKLQTYSSWWNPSGDSGVVNTSGTAVTWVSGTVFNAGMVGGTIVINSVNYTVSVFTDNHNITLSSTAGTQSGVAYTFATSQTDLWTLQTIGGSGASGSSTLKFSHTGTTGVTAVEFASPVTCDSTLSVGTDLSIAGKVGFYSTSPQSQPTITGSRGGNAALTSLLTALANLGLVTDSTT